MPTTVVSFLGTGRKASPQSDRPGYDATTYRFLTPQGREHLETTSLFGVALLNYLRHLGTAVDRWIVLGTSASLWSELNRALPDPDAVLEQYLPIDERVAAKTVDAPALTAWQDVLNTHSTPLEMRLCLTGEALSPNSQQQIARALFENVPPGNDIVFDISHGFRHQPVIATFIVSLMRWTHQIGSVAFYSGVFEARAGDITPVLALPICQQLVEATEAAAILDVTGNYEPVAGHLGLDASLAWFMESTNQLANARRPAQQLAERAPAPDNPAHEQLTTLLRQRLQWAAPGSYAERSRQSARTALDRGDYLRAVILAYEALITHALQLSRLGDPFNIGYRDQAQDALFERLTGADRVTLQTLQWTRNACAHGTRSDRAAAQQALRSPGDFRGLVQAALNLFDRLPDVLC